MTAHISQWFCLVLLNIAAGRMVDTTEPLLVLLTNTAVRPSRKRTLDLVIDARRDGNSEQ